MAEIFINADSGDDGTGDGSDGSPYETLAHAFDQSSAGDTITCQDSTATYDFVDDTFDHNITIQGESNDASGAVFDGGGVAQQVQWTLDGATISVKKITFQNARGNNTDPSTVFFFINDAIATWTNCIFKNILIQNQGTGNGGLMGTRYAESPGTTITCDKCLFNQIHKINPIDFGSIGAVFASREIDITLSSCAFYFNATGDDALDYFAQSHSGESDFMFVFIINCILSSDGDALSFGTNTADVDSYTYNCAYNFTDLPTESTGNITSDPLFIDPDNDNFNLRPSSPCIDAGVQT